VTAQPGDGTVSLSWESDPPDADLDRYEVWRSDTGETGTYVQIVPSTTGATYLDSGLANGSTYWYKVVAVDLLGGSSTSLSVSATPQLP
jgi:mannan endo-1,4-beta-mannosidase